jgi:hypothetical protein
MATKSLFGSMTNQKPAAVKPLKVQKPPGVHEFAFLGSNSLYRRPMSKQGDDLSSSVWARALNSTKKGKS